MFPTEKLLQCVISLLEGKILTGQDEITNLLVDRVADYIKESTRFHFAIEQFGITWEKVFIMIEDEFCFEEYYRQQVRCKDSTERIITRNDRKYFDN